MSARVQRRGARVAPRGAPAALSGFRVGERERRWALAADDRGGFVDQIVRFKSLDHEEREVDAAGDVALENGVADVAAPHGQALAVAFLEVAATHDGPAGVAGEDAAARLDLVV